MADATGGNEVQRHHQPIVETVRAHGKARPPYGYRKSCSTDVSTMSFGITSATWALYDRVEVHETVRPLGWFCRRVGIAPRSTSQFDEALF